jgi:anti-sigma regulatory factor (Ser/Thr protein kinase)
MTARSAVGAWPWSSTVGPLGALKSASGTARGHVRGVLAQWGMNHLADDMETIAGELVANAVIASTGNDDRPLYVESRMPVVRICLFTDGNVLRIEVWDEAGGIPTGPRDAGGEAEAGRGLWMVNALSADWGWFPGPDSKCVWAEMIVGQSVGAYSAHHR